MSKQKIFDKDGMDELFNIGPVEDMVEETEVEETAVTPVEAESNLPTVLSDEDEELVARTNENYVIDSLKEMYDDVQVVVAAAKYLIDSSPDADTIAAAGNLFQSASSLLKELNKGVLEHKRQRFTERLEKTKIKARMELAQFKANHDLNKLPNMGDGNTINIQNNNNMVQWNQESIIDSLVEKQKAEKQIVDSENDSDES
jgi:hypothetical protein